VLFALLLVVQAIVGLVAPDVFLGSIRFIQTPPVMYVAAALRVVFGVVLVCAALGSRVPRFLRVFGFIIVIGGLLTPFVGVWASQHILGWWSASGPALVRVFAGVSLMLGLLIVYAVAPNRRGLQPRIHCVPKLGSGTQLSWKLRFRPVASFESHKMGRHCLAPKPLSMGEQAERLARLTQSSGRRRCLNELRKPHVRQ